MIPTREELERLRELAGKATPGPWRVQTYARGVPDVINPNGEYVAQACGRNLDYNDPQTVTNANMIAAAHPAMIAHLLACEAALRKMLNMADCILLDPKGKASISGSVGDTEILQDAVDAARALIGSE